MIPEIIKLNCKQYLSESNGSILYKSLPSGMHPISKVKLRHKKIKADYERMFNETFSSEHKKMLQRCLVANTSSPDESIDADKELYYVFPVNGYRYLYNPIQNHYVNNYMDLFEYLENIGPDRFEIFSNTLKLSYKNENLLYGIQNSSEILFYNINHYYVIKKSIINEDDLRQEMQASEK